MNLIEIIRQTISAMRAHKLRSFLTMFGIVWGITSVILLVGLGIGFNLDQQRRTRTIGVDLAIIWGGRTSAQAGGYAAGRDIRLSVDDAVRIRKECYLIKHVSPELRRDVPEVSAFNAARRPVRGVWPEYQAFRSLVASEGRLMAEDDERNGQRVVVLGDESRAQLFPGKPAIGETLMMGGYAYTVIGVLEKKKQNGSYGSGPDNTQLFVPYSAMARDFPPTERPGIFKGWINNLVVEVVNPDEHEQAIAQVYRVLGNAHHFDPTDKDGLFIWDTLQGAKLNQRIFQVMTIFFGLVAVMTLSLGGIGVMNIMLISVTERTHEIGLRKAIGARRADIRLQFLLEAVALTLVGGTIGILVGATVSTMVRTFVPSIPASLSYLWVAIGFTISVSVGLFFGYYPANLAANLDPIVCLRYE